MPRRIIQKWRPPLWMVLGGTLGVVLCLPLAGIVFVRYLWPVIGYQEAVIVAGLGVVAATGVLGWMLWRILLRPMQALKARANGLRAGSRDALDPLEHYGTSDMGALGQSFLEMGRALQGREAVLRGYADHVTHELKSPLTAIRGAAELLRTEDLPEAERHRLLARIEQACERMAALLDAQRALARAQEPAASGKSLLSKVTGGLSSGITIEVAKDGPLPLPAEVLQLVLEHLVGNAARHGADSVILKTVPEGLLVSDNGSGISAGNRDQVFEPFFTTRREAGGTGMGLAIVRRVLQAHGAEIALLPEDTAKGAAFQIRF